MGEEPREVGAQRLADEQPKSADQLRAEIEDTRQDLGETVEALAAKTDVKTRARQKAEDLKRSATLKKDELLAKGKQASPVGGSAHGEATGHATAGGRSEDVANVLAQLKASAQENPVPVAALAGFIGGVAFTRLISRP